MSVPLNNLKKNLDKVNIETNTNNNKKLINNFMKELIKSKVLITTNQATYHLNTEGNLKDLQINSNDLFTVQAKTISASKNINQSNKSKTNKILMNLKLKNKLIHKEQKKAKVLKNKVLFININSINNINSIKPINNLNSDYSLNTSEHTQHKSHRSELLNSNINYNNNEKDTINTKYKKVLKKNYNLEEYYENESLKILNKLNDVLQINSEKLTINTHPKEIVAINLHKNSNKNINSYATSQEMGNKDIENLTKSPEKATTENTNSSKEKKKHISRIHYNTIKHPNIYNSFKYASKIFNIYKNNNAANKAKTIMISSNTARNNDKIELTESLNYNKNSIQKYIKSSINSSSLINNKINKECNNQYSAIDSLNNDQCIRMVTEATPSTSINFFNRSTTNKSKENMNKLTYRSNNCSNYPYSPKKICLKTTYIKRRIKSIANNDVCNNDVKPVYVEKDSERNCYFSPRALKNSFNNNL